MKPVPLLGVASYLPEKVVTNEFFAAGAPARNGMFTARRRGATSAQTSRRAT